jgi:hypothetical protein
MGGHAVVLTPSIMEQWFLKVEAALDQQQLVDVVPTVDGGMLEIWKDASLSTFLACRELRDDLKNIISHMRAARNAEALDEEAAAAELKAKIADMRERVGRKTMRELAALLRAEKIHGHSPLIDWLMVDGERTKKRKRKKGRHS